MPLSDKASLSMVVHGLVQGVFFRAFVSRHASALGLAGYVRNLPGEGIEVYAEGERKQLELLIDDLKVGPPGARVERLDMEWGEWARGLSHFEIRY